MYKWLDEYPNSSQFIGIQKIYHKNHYKNLFMIHIVAYICNNMYHKQSCDVQAQIFSDTVLGTVVRSALSSKFKTTIRWIGYLTKEMYLRYGMEKECIYRQLS